MEWARPVRGQQQHEHNLALVARLVAAHGPVSRATVARRSGLTKTTVTQLTGELLDGGLLRELGLGRAGGPGRPATLLVVNSSGPAGIGLQIEADHVAGCLVDLTGHVRDRALRRAGDLRADPDGALKATEPVLRRLLHTADGAENVVAGVAVGLPGRTTAAGLVRSPELDWPDLDLARLLERRVGALSGGRIPVAAHADHHLAALAERWFAPAGPEADTPLLYVGGELTLGAGLVTGADPDTVAAREIGHIRVRRRSRRCGCGGHGCLTTVAGPHALLRAAGLPDTAGSRLSGRAGGLTSLAASRERSAVTARRNAAGALADVLAGLVTLHEPGVVVLGGYLAPLGAPFADAVGDELARRCGAGRLDVRPSRLGGDTVARAAATTVTRELLAGPGDWLAG